MGVLVPLRPAVPSPPAVCRGLSSHVRPGPTFRRLILEALQVASGVVRRGLLLVRTQDARTFS